MSKAALGKEHWAWKLLVYKARPRLCSPLLPWAVSLVLVCCPWVVLLWSGEALLFSKDMQKTFWHYGSLKAQEPRSILYRMDRGQIALKYTFIPPLVKRPLRAMTIWLSLSQGQEPCKKGSINIYGRSEGRKEPWSEGTSGGWDRTWLRPPVPLINYVTLAKSPPYSECCHFWIGSEP